MGTAESEPLVISITNSALAVAANKHYNSSYEFYEAVRFQ